METSSSSSLEAFLLGQDLFSFLLENTPDQVYFKDTQGRFIRASRAVAEYMGAADPKDLLGKSDFDFWSSQTAQEAFLDEQQIIRSGQPMIGKIEKLTHPNGRVSWDYTTKLPLKDSRGRIIGICGINKDFTAIKEMQDALAEERNRLRATTAELEAKNAQLEADLRMARDVQLALLPRDYPTISHFCSSDYTALTFAHCYRPAEAVGGDFFDIFPFSPSCAGVFICDVMGHGLRAALITAVIRTLLEELRPLMDNPGRFLSALNLRLRAILERVDEPFIASAFYLVADTAANEMRFSNAGHPAPIRVRRSDRIVEQLWEQTDKPGPGLGLFDEISYSTSRSPFAQNDCILLFTDGLYEVDSPSGEAFGLSSLLASLRSCFDMPAKEMFNALLADACNFSRKQEFDDDVCIVAVEQS